MPYVRCPSCRLTTYCVRGALTSTECPGCGTPLMPGSAARAGRTARATHEEVAQPVPEPVDRALVLAMRELGMEVAFLSEVRGDREYVLRCAGDIEAFGLEDGVSAALDDTYCRQLLAGTIEGVVHDARSDERVRDLVSTRESGIGAYIGVPIHSWNARVYVLCCLAREARPSLDAGDLRFLRGLSETVAAHLPLPAAEGVR